MLKTSDFDYTLPEELIAQTPLPDRSSSRLLVLDKKTGEVTHRHFSDILDYLNPGDCLVLNNTRVIPARLVGRKPTGGAAEVLLLKRADGNIWECIGKGLSLGVEILFGTQVACGNTQIKQINTDKKNIKNLCESVHARSASVCGDSHLCAKIIKIMANGNRLIEFFYEGIWEEVLAGLGEMPLPPYIKEKLQDSERYQTVYSKEEGSAAAPTAGLHWTPGLLNKAKEKGIQVAELTLHVGLGTFRPVINDAIEKHQMHSEWFSLDEKNADIINNCTGRIIACGTTVVRVLETLAQTNNEKRITNNYGRKLTLSNFSIKFKRFSQKIYNRYSLLLIPYSLKKLKACSGETNIFIHPPYNFRIADCLITNFHLPKSTLLMLVSAFASREKILNAYDEAIKEEYRFFSFGDAMLII
ncbi:MAG: tRNA preQ1(34) S-adenosylmethionine ribosyltransferase-isomerase QueA [Oscillospiraceae bacterium]|nr:tRNA preQ1(34) S-adenosylmethionine ribosyltransferase-isomerase QueA [Oscillospiraceae bacterium]